MSFDRFYTYDKKTKRENYFGEVQTEFNMSFTCDGTKESCKVEIFNNVRKPLEPFTIILMKDTSTWWVVQKDKVQRYTNEIGGYYKHSISLLGAFELLNVRELTNCGFNVNKYTIRQFLTRLFSLSSFEFNISFGGLEEYINLDELITYLKTFQNYTLGSAIKELFAGMNLTPKLRFLVNPTTHRITSAVLGCYSRSGNSEETIDIESFDNAEEQSSFDGENFGTRVLSNVENCVSANVIRYPAIGGTRLTSDDATVRTGDNDNAILRLPSNVYKANKVIVYFPIDLSIAGGIKTLPSYDNCESIFAWFYSEVGITLTQAEKDTIIQWANENVIKTIESGGVYNNIDGTRTGQWLWVYSANTVNDEQIAFNSIQYAKTSLYTWDTITWEQGKNYLSNVRIVDRNRVRDYNTISIHGVALGCGLANLRNSGFAVEYVPMTDLVVKTDNDKDSNDTQLYNQNGKLVDSKAVSKLINSHTQEISSEEIVRYGTYYDFDSIPKPSTKVLFDNKTYIINNVSIDMHENDDDGYYLECMFTMTENVACKSIMVSANTNIRDYECPQQNNVNRIQTYRDYIEFTYDLENIYNEELYNRYSLREMFPFVVSFYRFNEQLEAFIDVYSSNFGANSDNGHLYYHIPSVRYDLNKLYIERIDFKDNNIIGYEAGKSYFVFQFSTLIARKEEVVNTPINYVDEQGCIESIKLSLTDLSGITYAYTKWEDVPPGVLPTTYTIETQVFNNFVSVPKECYEKIVGDINIEEEEYNKDGLEVPVFEYCCEVGNSEGIIFGDDVLKRFDKYGIDLIAILVDKEIAITQENYSLYLDSDIYEQKIITCSIDNDTRNKLYINFSNEEVHTQNKTIIIVANWVDEITQEGKYRLLFALNNCRKDTIIDTYGNYNLILGINNYRLR